jgi:hypothetical protein
VVTGFKFGEGREGGGKAGRRRMGAYIMNMHCRYDIYTVCALEIFTV